MSESLTQEDIDKINKTNLKAIDNKHLIRALDVFNDKPTVDNFDNLLKLVLHLDQKKFTVLQEKLNIRRVNYLIQREEQNRNYIILNVNSSERIFKPTRFKSDYEYQNFIDELNTKYLKLKKEELEEAKRAVSTAQPELKEAESAVSTAQTELDEAQSAASTAQTELDEAQSAASTAKMKLDEAQKKEDNVYKVNNEKILVAMRDVINNAQGNGFKFYCLTQAQVSFNKNPSKKTFALFCQIANTHASVQKKDNTSTFNKFIDGIATSLRDKKNEIFENVVVESRETYKGLNINDSESAKNYTTKILENISSDVDQAKSTLTDAENSFKSAKSSLESAQLMVENYSAALINKKNDVETKRDALNKYNFVESNQKIPAELNLFSDEKTIAEEKIERTKNNIYKLTGIPLDDSNTPDKKLSLYQEQVKNLFTSLNPEVSIQATTPEVSTQATTPEVSNIYSAMKTAYEITSNRSTSKVQKSLSLKGIAEQFHSEQNDDKQIKLIILFEKIAGLHRKMSIKDVDYFSNTDSLKNFYKNLNLNVNDSQFKIYSIASITNTLSNFLSTSDFDIDDIISKLKQLKNEDLNRYYKLIQALKNENGELSRNSFTKQVIEYIHRDIKEMDSPEENNIQESIDNNAVISAMDQAIRNLSNKYFADYRQKLKALEEIKNQFNDENTTDTALKIKLIKRFADIAKIHRGYSTDLSKSFKSLFTSKVPELVIKEPNSYELFKRELPIDISKIIGLSQDQTSQTDSNSQLMKKS
jgi:hypothetical protein